MKLVFASSPSHDILKRFIFLGTLCDPWEPIELRFTHAGRGDFGSPEFNRVVTERVTLMHEIASDSKGEIIVFSDVDVQWFRPAQNAIAQALEGVDVVFQREIPDHMVANSGFLAIRSNERSLAYLQELRAAAKTGRHDQEVTNELIAQGRMPCPFGFLPLSFHNDNHTGRWRPPPREMVLYHSVGTFATLQRSSVQIKLEKHLVMRSRILESSAIFRPAEEMGLAIAPAVSRKYRSKLQAVCSDSGVSEQILDSTVPRGAG